MQVLKGVKVALVHCLLFFQIDLADEITVIAADYIRIVFGHSATLWGWSIVELFSVVCTKAVYLGFWDISPVVKKTLHNELVRKVMTEKEG
jgi:hypothetical protein